METVYDIQQLLKQFGIVIYTGNRLADLDFMEEEIRELYECGLIEKSEFTTVTLILRNEKRKYKTL